MVSFYSSTNVFVKRFLCFREAFLPAAASFISRGNLSNGEVLRSLFTQAEKTAILTSMGKFHFP